MIESVGGSANCLAPGVQIGEYRLLDVIGEGGFGIVYRARDISLDRVVAIKEYMPATLAGRKSSNEIHVRSQHRGAFDAGLRSFINEARLLAKFSQPALVHVYRFFEFNGTAYMVMRHYEGQTFRAFLSAQPERMSQRMLSAIVSPVLDVVEMLHAADCYHRDIAPDNVFLQNTGMPVLLDFGAARRIIGDMTQALTMVLKPGFAPIEQYVDDGAMPQGAWTDIYQIGAMLYLAITGKAPATSVARMINDPVVELSPANYPGYSSQFLHGVHRALAVKPQDRPQTLAELKELLGITTFTSPVATPWANTAPAGLSNAWSDEPGPLIAPGNMHAQRTSMPEQASGKSTEVTPQEPPTDWGQFGRTPPGPPAHGGAGVSGNISQASAGSAPFERTLSLEWADQEVDATRNHGVTAIEQGVRKDGSETATVTAIAAPEIVISAQAPPRSTIPTSKAAVLSRTGVSRWMTLVFAVALISTLAFWWDGRDTSASSQGPLPVTMTDEAQWREASVLGTAAALDAYLKSQPTGAYRSDALAQLDRIEATEAAQPASATTPPSNEAVAVALPPPSPERAGLTDPATKALPAPGVGSAPSATEPASVAKAVVKPPGDLGRVVFRISPWGRISANGNSIGTTPPLTQIELPEGTHRIEVTNPAAAPVVRTVLVKKGEPVVFSHQFE